MICTKLALLALFLASSYLSVLSRTKAQCLDMHILCNSSHVKTLLSVIISLPCQYAAVALQWNWPTVLRLKPRPKFLLMVWTKNIPFCIVCCFSHFKKALLCHNSFHMYVCMYVYIVWMLYSSAFLVCHKGNQNKLFFTTFKARQTRLVCFIYHNRHFTQLLTQLFSSLQYLALNTCSNTYRMGKLCDSPVFV